MFTQQHCYKDGTLVVLTEMYATKIPRTTKVEAATALEMAPMLLPKKSFWKKVGNWMFKSMCEIKPTDKMDKLRAVTIVFGYYRSFF